MGLIDATKAIESIDEIVCSMSVCINTDYCHGMTAMKDAAIHAVENQPTVDAVPVVRCRECRWACLAPQRQTATCMKKRLPFTHDYDFYCADGERRTE